MREPKPLFDRKTSFLIAAFIVALFFTLEKCEAAETSMHFAPIVAVGGHIGSDSFQIGITERFLQRYEFEANLTRYEGRMYKNVTTRRIIGDYKFKFLFGVSWWPDWSPGTGSTMTFNLGMRYDFSDRFALDYNHNSDAGSNDHYNDGLDVISVRYSFGK